MAFMREETTGMAEPLTVEEVDSDGALREAADRVGGDTRAAFLRKGTLAGALAAAAGASGVLAAPAHAVTRDDIAILNFALTLEHLEAEFYTEAVRLGALKGETRAFARVVGAHERTHVSFLQKALGRAAVAKPSFNFRGTTENQKLFQATAIVLEDTGVQAYKGQAPNIDDKSVLAAALSIHSVEARHAAWIRHIAGMPPAPTAFDPAATMAQVLAAVASTGFIVGARPRTGVRRPPSFTG